MKVQKSSGTQGAWLDKKKLQKKGDIIKLVSEAKEEEGQNGIQLVAKCRVKGWEGEAMNIAINKPSMNGLIEAFGDDTKDWINKELAVETETGIFAGKRGVALYLIPEGFELSEDAGGYLVITKKGGGKDAEIPVIEDEENIDAKDIPF